MPILRSPHKLRQSTLNRRMQLVNVEANAEQQLIVQQNPIAPPIIEEAPNLQQNQNSVNETLFLGPVGIRRRIMAGPEQAINLVADNVNNLNMNEEDLLQDNGNGIQFQRVDERDQREGGDPIEREQRFIAPEIDNFGGEWDAERVFNPRAASTPHMVLEREPHKQIVTARQLPETGYQHERGEQAQVRPNPGHMAQNQQRAAAYNQQHQYAHRVGPEPDDDRFYQRAHPATHTAAGPTDVTLGPPPRHGHYYQEYQQQYNAPPPNFEHRGGYGRQNHGDEFGGGWTRNQPPPNFRREDQNFAAHQRGQAQYHPQRERHHAEYQQPQPIQIGNLEYGNVAEDRNRMAPTNNFRRFQQVRSPNFGQNVREGIVCFNCNEPGHISRECRQPRRQTQFNAEQLQNRPQMATGANNTPMRMTEGEERMETDNLDNPLSWDTQCGGLGLEHRHCAQLTASDLDPVLEKAGLGLKVVGTPMKAVLASFLLKSSAVSSTAGGRKLAQMNSKLYRRHSKRGIIPICVDFNRRPVECPKKFKKLKLDEFVMQQLRKPIKRLSLKCYLNMLPSRFCFRSKSKL
ncbi:hypothetical protein GPALN_006916 [Globodera pallida]|nr:hypothetical protein GPALN_006916 [Globodera pallida]